MKQPPAAEFSWVVPAQGAAQPDQSCPCHSHPMSFSSLSLLAAGCSRVALLWS